MEHTVFNCSPRCLVLGGISIQAFSGRKATTAQLTSALNTRNQRAQTRKLVLLGELRLDKLFRQTVPTVTKPRPNDLGIEIDAAAKEPGRTKAERMYPTGPACPAMIALLDGLPPLQNSDESASVEELEREQATVAAERDHNRAELKKGLDVLAEGTDNARKECEALAAELAAEREALADARAALADEQSKLVAEREELATAQAKHKAQKKPGRR